MVILTDVICFNNSTIEYAQQNDNWGRMVIEYLEYGTLPVDSKMVRRVATESQSFKWYLVHSNRLKPYMEPSRTTLTDQRDVQREPINQENQHMDPEKEAEHEMDQKDIYYVKKILDIKKQKGKTFYLIKWLH